MVLSARSENPAPRYCRGAPGFSNMIVRLSAWSHSGRLLRPRVELIEHLDQGLGMHAVEFLCFCHGGSGRSSSWDGHAVIISLHACGAMHSQD